MNCYATLTDVKANLDESTTDYDALLLRLLKSVSRQIDNATGGRHFYVWSGAKKFDTQYGSHLFIPDLLSASAVATDTDQDGAFDDETWVEGTDYNFFPYNSFPKQEIKLTSYGNYGFASLNRAIQITGMWGYGDGIRATPYDTITPTITVVGATTTLGTVTATTDLVVGQTLLLSTEQVFVSAIPTSTTLTITRGVNGTTAADHPALTAINIYRYPEDISDLCAYWAAGAFKARDRGDLVSETIGDWSGAWGRSDKEANVCINRILSPYERLAVA